MSKIYTMGGNPCSEIYLVSSECVLGKNIVFKKFMKISLPHEVDGEPWFTVHMEPEVLLWIKSLKVPDMWHDNKENTHWSLRIDMCERLYTMMALRWA